MGVVTTLVPAPALGTQFSSPYHAAHDRTEDFHTESSNHHRSHRTPKIDFPSFDGTDPHNWRMRCENYFDVCETHPQQWVRVATIYFTGRAAS